MVQAATGATWWCVESDMTTSDLGQAVCQPVALRSVRDGPLIRRLDDLVVTFEGFQAAAPTMLGWAGRGRARRWAFPHGRRMQGRARGGTSRSSDPVTAGACPVPVPASPYLLRSSGE